MSLARRDNGCYQCYKRRLKCDKAEPTCLKCVKKGLDCSGQGLRCRFSNQMKFKQVTFDASSTATSPAPSVKKRNKTSQSSRAQKQYQWVRVGGAPTTCDLSPSQSSMASNIVFSNLERISPALEKDGAESAEDNTSLTSHSPLRASLDEFLHPQARMLFNYYSEFVAPIMVVFDLEDNGYRDVILPLACCDAVLQRAVSVTATFHMAQKTPELRHIAEAGHHAIIEKLRRDSLQCQQGEVFNHFTLATVLVLLIGETITGADNYTFLLEILDCFTKVLGVTVHLPNGLEEFFWQQIRMFQLFGLPLANEAKGLQLLEATPAQYFEFLAYPRIGPETTHYKSLGLIRASIQDACGLYRRRVESSLCQEESIHLVDQLRQKISVVGLNFKGAHALVWTCFIGAAESIVPEHRVFFSDCLRSLYQLTGFGSIPAALEALETIWECEPHRRWTEVMTNDIPILVM